MRHQRIRKAVDDLKKVPEVDRKEFAVLDGGVYTHLNIKYASEEDLRKVIGLDCHLFVVSISVNKPQMEVENVD